MIDAFGMQSGHLIACRPLGIACIPATYYPARTALGRAIDGGLPIAGGFLSHFFSQNARGYTGLLL
jgi:hypothetical protein